MKTPCYDVSFVNPNYSLFEEFFDSQISSQYQIKYFATTASALVGIQVSAPHILVIGPDVHPSQISDFLDKVHRLSPETLVIQGVESQYTMSAIQHMRDRKLYDYFVYPVLSKLELIYKMDRAANQIYLVYENETLRKKRGIKEISYLQKPQEFERLFSPQSYHLNFKGIARKEELEHHINAQVDIGTQWVRERIQKMSSLRDQTQLMKSFLESLNYMFSKTPILYFKYLPQKMNLLLSNSVGVSWSQQQNYGLQISADTYDKIISGQNFLPEMNAIIEKLFSNKEYILKYHISNNDFYGVFVILKKSFTPQQSLQFDILNQFFNTQYLSNEFFKDRHSLQVYDQETSLFNKKNFSLYLVDEVSRSRRIQMPLTLVVLQIDQLPQILQQAGGVAFRSILLSLTKSLQKNFRTSDRIFRLSQDQLAIVLPHTSAENAVFKFEKLRRAFELLDFSDKLPSLKLKPSLSIGVSEYPNRSQDAEDLLRSADEALNKIVDAGGNGLALWKAADNFKADFTVGI